MTKTMYKIRRREDGLFSTGGSIPGFNSIGKFWTGIGPLKNHIRCVTYYDKQRDEPEYAGCEIVEFETREIKSFDAMEFISEYKLYDTKN
jgi:hypothetical protein